MTARATAVRPGGRSRVGFQACQVTFGFARPDCSGLRERPTTWMRAAVRPVACCLALLAIWQLFTTAGARTVFPTRRGTVLLRQPDTALQFIQEHASRGEEVFIYPYYPMYYFLANVTNPTRYSILMYHMNTAAEFHEVVDALERGRVRFVLSDTVVSGSGFTRYFPQYQHPGHESQILEQYLKQHYEEVAVENHFRILKRIGSADAP